MTGLREYIRSKIPQPLDHVLREKGCVSEYIELIYLTCRYEEVRRMQGKRFTQRRTVYIENIKLIQSLVSPNTYRNNLNINFIVISVSKWRELVERQYKKFTLKSFRPYDIAKKYAKIAEEVCKYIEQCK